MSTPIMSTTRMSTPIMSTTIMSTPKMSTPKMSVPKCQLPKMSTPKMSNHKMLNHKMSITSFFDSLSGITVHTSWKNKQPRRGLALPLNRVVGKAHPNIYELIEVFKREEAATSVAACQLQAGGRAPPRKRKAIEKYRRLKELKRRLDVASYPAFPCVRFLSLTV